MNRRLALRLRALGRGVARLVAWQPRNPFAPAPALERRRPRVAAEDYAARNLIEHTLDRKAGLRRLAPMSHEAAQRYHQLLTYELTGLNEVARVLRASFAGPDVSELLAETDAELERLRIEVAWCERQLRREAGGKAGGR